MRTRRRDWMVATLALAFLFAAARPAAAIPLLQLYLEGATYDAETETWQAAPPGSSQGGPFYLWTIGNVAGPGGKGTIHEVRLAVAYDRAYVGEFDFEIELLRLGDGALPYEYEHLKLGFDGGFADPDDAEATVRIDPDLTNYASPHPYDWGIDNPTLEDTDGRRPELSDGRKLAWHGVYGAGTVWEEFHLGDFALTDSPVADVIGQFPDNWYEDSGQINIYEIRLVGENLPGAIYFDLYNHVESGNRARAVFAPFSHTATIIPEPATLLALIGLLPLLIWRRLK